MKTFEQSLEKGCWRYKLNATTEVKWVLSQMDGKKLTNVTKLYVDFLRLACIFRAIKAERVTQVKRCVWAADQQLNQSFRTQILDLSDSFTSSISMLMWPKIRRPRKRIFVCYAMQFRRQYNSDLPKKVSTSVRKKCLKRRVELLNLTHCFRVSAICKTWDSIFEQKVEFFDERLGDQMQGAHGQRRNEFSFSGKNWESYVERLLHENK